MSIREDECGECGGCRDDDEAALVLVDFYVPAAPDLSGYEHAASAAHVSEGSLTGAVGTGATDTRDTGDGALTGGWRLFLAMSALFVRLFSFL